MLVSSNILGKSGHLHITSEILVRHNFRSRKRSM